ncbi:MAG TPA: Rid family detoxifying hydrolase [Symbiobacteriaceae bacterium]|nr:Rid family detoxifying hydrolase [Symbiobacteriaceae bacterium]
MSAKIPVHPAGAPIPAGPYTPAIIAGDFVYVSGQGPLKPGSREVVPGGIAEHTTQVLENIKTILAAAGCTMADVVKVQAHLKDMKDFAAYNEVYGRYFPQPYPARTTVQSVLPGADYLVEIDVVALRTGREA